MQQSNLRRAAHSERAACASASLQAPSSICMQGHRMTMTCTRILRCALCNGDAGTKVRETMSTCITTIFRVSWEPPRDSHGVASMREEPPRLPMLQAAAEVHPTSLGVGVCGWVGVRASTRVARVFAHARAHTRTIAHPHARAFTDARAHAQAHTRTCTHARTPTHESLSGA